MRVFILVALLAMAATVSCQDISPACNSTTNALDVASVNDAEKAITKGACTQVNFDITSNQCTYDNTTSIYSCLCATTLSNTAPWESAVRNISNGRPCYLDMTFTLTGTVKVDNTTTKPITFNATQTNADTIAIGGNCTNTEIEAGLAKAVQVGVDELIKQNLNANSASTGVTWTTGTATVSGCGVSKKSAVTNIPAAGTTTAPPTTPSGTTTTPPTVPPSSTGKSGASIIASSFALVASLCAAVTILA